MTATMQVLLLFSFFVLLARHGYSQALGHDGNGSQPSGLGNSSALPASINRPAPLPRNSSSTIKSLYQAYSDKTPKFINQPLIQFLSDNPDARLDRMSPNSLSLLKKRQSDDLPEGVCAPGQPCRNGARCSNTGVCSYAPSSCAPDVCISNCDAKAPCGPYADPASASCPLNVCCSQHGFCKSREEHWSPRCPPGLMNRVLTWVLGDVQAVVLRSSVATGVRRASEAVGLRPPLRAPARAAVWSGTAGSATTRAGRRRSRATPSRPRTWTCRP